MVSSEAEAMNRESEDHDKSEMPSSCPERAFSSEPSCALQMRIVQSPDAEASHLPSGLWLWGGKEEWEGGDRE